MTEDARWLDRTVSMDVRGLGALLPYAEEVDSRPVDEMPVDEIAADERRLIVESDLV